MKVFVTGSTGVVGRRAVSLLVNAGHDVTALARTPAKAEIVESIGARAVAISLFDVGALTNALAGHEAICNLATAIPSVRRSGRTSAWVQNDLVRTLGSQTLVDAALATGVNRIIQESITFLYADAGEQWITERASIEPSTTGRSALLAEAQVQRFVECGGAGVILRFGSFYGPDSSHTLVALGLARHGIASNLGREGAYLSPLTTNDAAAAVLLALTAPTGTYNVVDDEPLTRRDYFDSLAVALGRKPLRLLPAFVGSLAGPASSMATRSQRVSNSQFRETTGWSPTYPSARQGWRFVVGAIEREG